MSVQEANLKAIADAIREQEGSSNPIAANDFAQRILSLPQGVILSVVSAQAGTTQEEKLSAIAEAIRQKEGSSDPVLASDFSARILALEKKAVSRLPEGYTEVLYIQSDSECSIYPKISSNKPYYHSKYLSIEMTVEIPGEYVSGTKNLFTSYSVGSIAFSCGFSRKGINSYSYWFGGLSKKITLDIIGKKIVIRGDAPKKIFSIDSTEYALDAIPDSGTYQLYLFGGQTNTSKSIIAKLYGCKIYGSTSLNTPNIELVRDLIPCIAPSGTVGLYDLIEKTFYENRKTGTFTAGPAV